MSDERRRDRRDRLAQEVGVVDGAVAGRRPLHEDRREEPAAEEEPDRPRAAEQADRAGDREPLERRARSRSARGCCRAAA